MKLFTVVLYILFVVATTNALRTPLEIITELNNNKDFSTDNLLDALSSELGVNLRQHTRNNARDTCEPTPAFKYCTMIDYPVVNAQTALDLDEIYYNAYKNISNQFMGECDSAWKSFMCGMIIPKCSNGEELELCASVCIDFTAKCASFLNGGWCLSDRSFVQKGQGACTAITSNPPIACTVPTGLTTCSKVVNYGIPSSSVNASGVWTGLDTYVNAFLLYSQMAVDVMKTNYGWSDATAKKCMDTYNEYYCRYTFLECTDGDPYSMTPPCAYTCDGIYAACPEIWKSGMTGQTCLNFFPNLTCSTTNGSVVSWSWSFGDPHLSTLDGYGYEFNGAGEYWLTVSDDSSVQVQARFEPCGLGTCTTALAFCLGTNCASKYMIVATSATALSVTLNGAAVTLPSRIGADGIITDPDNSAGVVFSVGGKGGYFKVTPGASISFVAGFKASWYGKLRGLLGLFSGDIADDLTPLSGSALDPVSSRQQEIFTDFGQTWRVPQAESLFTYSNGKTYNSINNLTYVPIFSDEPSFIVSQEAETACEASGLSGSFLTACKFDVTVTQDNSFVAASQRAQTQTTALPSNIDSQLEVINPTPTTAPTTAPTSAPTSKPPATSTTTGTPTNPTNAPGSTSTTSSPSNSSGASSVAVSMVMVTLAFLFL